MTILFIHLLMLLPVYGEAAFDSTMWWYYKDDKPWSTYVVRPILFLIGSYWAYRLGDKEWWRVIFVMVDRKSVV